VLVYKYNGAVWSLQQTIAGDSTWGNGVQLGTNVTMSNSGDRIFATMASAINGVGAVFVYYSADLLTWVEEDSILPRVPNQVTDDEFAEEQVGLAYGSSLATTSDGSFLAVAASGWGEGGYYPGLLFTV
jgi:hypothetical protein